MVRKFFEKKLYFILVILLFVAGTLLRGYNYPNRIIFGPEQGMSLITAASNIQKFSLLGETNFIRATSDNHIPFHGALYSYLLLPFLVIFNYHIFPITFVFLILNLITALMLFLVSNKIFGKKVAIFSLFYFMFSAVMIHHSLFTWIVNPTPLLAVLTLLLTHNVFVNKKTYISVLLLGFLSGLGFGMQNLYLPFAFLVLAISVVISKVNKLLVTILYLLGVLIGSLPTALFDIRHDFYHVRTFWQFFIDVINHRASGSSVYYNYLYLFPYLFILLALVTTYLYKKNKLLMLIPMVLFSYLNIKTPYINFMEPTGMAKGLTYKSIYSFADAINKENPTGKFNIATLWDFDTRGYPLRYLLEYVYKKKPLGVEEYTDLDTLFVVAPKDYDVKNATVWEISVNQPYNISEIKSDVDGYRIYKFSK